MADDESTSDPIIIKKYANRRLYDTGSSSYITLEHLGEMTRKGVDFKVVDAKTGEDITRSVLTQIIMDEENRGQTMLPTNFLRQLISMYGDSMQSMVPPYLEASMAALRRNQEQFRKSMSGALGPFEAIAKQNMAMFQAAAEMMTGKRPSTDAGGPVSGDADEIAEMKRQMAELQAKLDRLSKV
jgi:polyhydroxyalkanoate synthesis repressor PhaR